MLQIGVTFYPDQWPKEYWNKAFSEIASAGFKIVRFGEMAWNWMEPKEGKFDFSGLDEAMELAKKHGLKILLGIPASQAPSWLISKYPEIRPVADDGTLYPEYGPRPNLCRDSSVHKKFAKRLIENLVKRYAKHPALYMWQMDNEPTYPPLDSTTQKDFCHCKATESAFRKWAKKEYENITKLNEKWGTKFWTVEFSSFDEITPPRCGMWDAGNPHIFLDWFRFKSIRLKEYLSWAMSVIKGLDKEHKVGTNGFIGICSRVPDHDILASEMQWYGLDVYPKGNKAGPMDLARMLDLWRGYVSERDCEFHVTELQGGQNVRWGYPGPVDGKDIRLWTHQTFAHGARTVLYHAWRAPLFGSETGGFGILKLNGSRSERLEKIEGTIKEIDKISYIIDKSEIISKVAIAFLRSSEVGTYEEQGPPRNISGQWMEVRSDIGLMHGLLSVSGAHSSLWNHHNPVSFIFERHLEAGKTLPFEAILLPNPYILKDKSAKLLRKFVYDGGILITEARFGLKNENAHLYETPLMEGLLDIKYDHTEIIDREIKISAMNVKAAGFRDIVDASDNNVIASFDDGHPAIIEKRIGKGRVIYAAFSLFLSALNDENKELINFIRKHLPEPEFKITNSNNVEMAVLSSDKTVLYIINHSNIAQSPIIKLPRKYKGAKDILNGGAHTASEGSMFLEIKGADIKVLVLE
ncbi:MAG: beta-galactosidase, partial [bacterium]